MRVDMTSLTCAFLLIQGNMGSSSTENAPQDLYTPTIKQDIYTTGRGGNGNMARYDPEHPEYARESQDLNTPQTPRSATESEFHYGRGEPPSSNSLSSVPDDGGSGGDGGGRGAGHSHDHHPYQYHHHHSRHPAPHYLEPLPSDSIQPIQEETFGPSSSQSSIYLMKASHAGGAANVGKPTANDILQAKIEQSRWDIGGRGEAPVDHEKLDYRGWADKGRDLILGKKRK